MKLWSQCSKPTEAIDNPQSKRECTVNRNWLFYSCFDLVTGGKCVKNFWYCCGNYVNCFTKDTGLRKLQIKQLRSEE